MAGKQWLTTRSGRIALAALSWTILGCLFALPDLSAGGERRQSLLLSLSLWWSWGLVTPLILWVDRRIRIPLDQLPGRILAHVVPSLLVTAAYPYLLGAMRTAMRVEDSMGGMFYWNWLVYWLILGAWQALRYYDHYVAAAVRAERLEKSFSEARLNALRMQLDPHFLFNALNTISSQLERDPRLARGMIEHLGDLLRLSLASRDRQEVPLAEEMAFLTHYLAIQEIRFGSHLRIELQIAQDVKYASVPCLFVQPLVENAIRHGISRRASGGTVTVSARRDGNRLDIRVLDDGVGLPDGWTLDHCAGTGLSVTKERVNGLYPEGEASFAVKRRAGGGTEVEISLPLRWSETGAHAALAL
jgi:signal transduction histidine kinase